MKIGFSEPAARFVSASQTARVDTEDWARSNMFCPNCGCSSLLRYPANKPVADFYCAECGDQYELKSQSTAFSRKVADGAYHTKIERLTSDTSPNLILMQYNREQRRVENLTVVPRYFFVQGAIERRPPLRPTARRAGWVGSNILLDRIPVSGQISVIRSGLVRDRREVLAEWNRLRFIEERRGEARGWLLEVMRCVQKIGQPDFTLADVYDFERELSALFPHNKNVRPKIRQQLQVLRDAGYLNFLGNGHYTFR
ncbi:MAG: DpnI domain-containing protein [Paracoccaceae bacterium]